MAANTVTHKMIANTDPMAYQINIAFAQLLLFGFSLEPKAQTNNMIKPTSGINEIKRVTTQSLVDNTGAVC